MSSRAGEQDWSPATESVPVLVLGAHRSGTSAITGLLAQAGGLRLGDVMPATAANPRGYFESTSIVRAHNRLLETMDRDWTCPPAWFDPEDVVLDGLAEDVATLAAEPGQWGAKDPRLLFLLPAWAELLDEVRFIGVIRDHEEVVRSLVARDGIDPGVAEGIARAHVHRLRRLRDRWAFPIVDFSAPPEQVLETVARVADWLGLDFDAAIASDFLDPSLTTGRARGALDSADVEHLRKLVDQDWEDEPIAAADLAGFLAALDGDGDELDRYSGPRTPGRRRRAWSAVPRDLDRVVEYTRNLRIASAVDPAPDHAVVAEVRDLHALYVELRWADTWPEAVVLPDLTSWVEGEDLVGVFELLHEFLDDHGLVVVGISTADHDTNIAMGRAPVTGDQVVAAARKAGFLLGGRDHDGHLDRVRLIARTDTDRLLRRVVEESLGQAGGRSERLAHDRSSRFGSADSSPTRMPGTRASATRSSAVAWTDDDWRRKYERLRGRRVVRATLAVADRAGPLVRAVRSVTSSDDDATGAPSGPVGTEAASPAAPTAAGSGRPTGGGPDWQGRYERLRDRRSVRLAVSAADTTQPLFKVVRRFRQR